MFFYITCVFCTFPFFEDDTDIFYLILAGVQVLIAATLFNHIYVACNNGMQGIKRCGRGDGQCSSTEYLFGARRKIISWIPAPVLHLLHLGYQGEFNISWNISNENFQWVLSLAFLRSCWQMKEFARCRHLPGAWALKDVLIEWIYLSWLAAMVPQDGDVARAGWTILQYNFDGPYILWYMFSHATMVTSSFSPFQGIVRIFLKYSESILWPLH